LTCVCRGPIRRPADLRPDLVLLVGRPTVAQITNLNMEPAKLPIDFQILNIHITHHICLLNQFSPKPETLTPEYACTCGSSLAPRPLTLLTRSPPHRHCKTKR